MLLTLDYVISNIRTDSQVKKTAATIRLNRVSEIPQFLKYCARVLELNSLNTAVYDFCIPSQDNNTVFKTRQGECKK